MMDHDPYNLRQIIKDRIHSVSPPVANGGQRCARHMSYKQLSDMIGVSKTVVSRFMRDEGGFSMASLERLLCLLDLRLVPGEFLPIEVSNSPVYRKKNTVLNAKLKEAS